MPRDRRSGWRPRDIVSPAMLYGWFAFVMATGIVSIATGLTGLGTVSTLLYGLNLMVFPALWVWLLIRLLRDPGFVRADLCDHGRAPRMLTVVAATCVLGNEMALASGHEAVVGGLWAAAALLWCALVYCLFAALTMRPEKPPLERGIDGSWLLVVVATEALSILTTRIAGTLAPPAPALLASLCLFLLGGAFYGMLLLLIVYRWLFLPMRPDHMTPAYWINMGAAAIATLAGTRVLAALGGGAAFMPVRGFVFTATILFWSLASWWIPLLAALTLWQRRGSSGRLANGLDDWSMVFPLGMYATATWRLSHAAGFPFLQVVPRVFVWVALAAWCITLFGTVRAVVRPCRESIR